MLKLEDLKPGLSLVGLEPVIVATLVAVVPIALHGPTADAPRNTVYPTAVGTLFHVRLTWRLPPTATRPAGASGASPRWILK